MVKSEHNKNSSVIGGAVSLTFSVIIVKIIGFMYKVPLSHVLGDGGMGYFNSAYSVFAFFYMLCSGGVPRAVSVIVAEAAVDKRGVGGILKIALAVFGSVGLLFTFVLLFFACQFARLIGNSLSYFSLLTIAPALTFVASAGVLKGYQNGIGKAHLTAISEVIEGGAKFILGLALALFASSKGYGVEIVSAYTILGVTLGSLFSVIFLSVCSKSSNTEENIEQNAINKIKTSLIIKKILMISFPITVSAAVMGISNIIDLGMIMKRLVGVGFAESEAVKLYGNFTTLAIPMLNLVAALSSPLSVAAMPHLARLYASGEVEKYSSSIEWILTASSLFSVPLGFAYALFPEEILMLLFEGNSARAAAPLLAMLAPSVIFLPLLTVINTALEASMRPRIPFLAMTLGALVKTFSSYILIGKFGIVGAPISTSLCYSVAFVASAVAFIVLRGAKVSFISPLIKTSFASAMSIGVAALVYNNAFRNSFDPLIFLVFAFVSAVFYTIIICLIMRERLVETAKFVIFAKKNKKSL